MSCQSLRNYGKLGFISLHHLHFKNYYEAIWLIIKTVTFKTVMKWWFCKRKFKNINVMKTFMIYYSNTKDIKDVHLTITSLKHIRGNKQKILSMVISKLHVNEQCVCVCFKYLHHFQLFVYGWCILYFSNHASTLYFIYILYRKIFIIMDILLYFYSAKDKN